MEWEGGDPGRRPGSDMAQQEKKRRRLGLLPRLVLAIALGLLAGGFARWAQLPLLIRAGATFNSIFGNFLTFCIPLIIIGFVVPGIAELGRGAGRLLGLTALLAYLSTVLAGLAAVAVGKAVFPRFLRPGSLSLDSAAGQESMLPGLFEVELPPVMGVMTALLLAFVLGLGIAAVRSEPLRRAFCDFQAIIEKLVARIILPLLPVHVYGIFANMTYTGAVGEILRVFARVFAVIVALHLCVMALQYVAAGAVAGKNPVSLLRRMVPAYVTALGTQSSAAAIPVTVRCTKQNGVRDTIAEFVCPLCATIHLSGSTISLTSCALAILMLGGRQVSVGEMVPFVLMLGVTMVAAPGVPGGAVMAALGVLESMLGFTDAMLTLMIALYIAQDSFGTACNVTGDGAIAVVMDALAGRTT